MPSRVYNVLFLCTGNTARSILAESILRKDGAVATTWRESTSGPPRRYYSLTAAGHQTLERFTGEWTRFRDAVDAVLQTGEGRWKPRLRDASSSGT